MNPPNAWFLPLAMASVALLAPPVLADPVPSPVLTWGTLGAGPSNLDHPFGIATDNLGSFFVADQHNQRVQVFDATGGLIRSFGSPGTGPGQLEYPSGICLSPDGAYVYVVENQNHRVSKFTRNGVFVQWIGSITPDGLFHPGYFYYPVAAACDASGNLLVVDSEDNVIQRFTSTGTLIDWFGGYGSGPGQLEVPYGIDIDAAGNIYVGEYNGNRVSKFSPAGNFLLSWGSFGGVAGQFYAAEGIAHDAAGNIYVCDTGNNRIQKFRSDGTFVLQFGVFGGLLGQLYTPSDIAIDPNGDLFIAEWNNARIQRFSTSGATPAKHASWGSVKNTYR